MLLTEAEAAKKRCTPALVILLMPKVERNGMAAAGAEVGSSCIGSRCAQWCWYDYANEAGKTFFQKGEDMERANFHRGRRSPSKQVESEERPARGYCGLTGSRE